MAASSTRMYTPNSFPVKLPQAETQIVSADAGVPEGWLGLDVGPETLVIQEKELSECKTIIWNGPMGVFEMPK